MQRWSNGMENPINIMSADVREITKSGIETGSEKDLEKVELVNQLNQHTRKWQKDPDIGDARIPSDLMTDAIVKIFQEGH